MKKRVTELPLQAGIGELHLSVTIGVALAHTEEADLESLITRADQTLYVGKHNGRNRVVMCREGMEGR